jgi:DNA repair exonuclease SbcCD ATPase subunit
MAVIDLKEEYSSKLMILSEKNESLRSKLQKENSKL